MQDHVKPSGTMESQAHSRQRGSLTHPEFMPSQSPKGERRAGDAVKLHLDALEPATKRDQAMPAPEKRGHPDHSTPSPDTGTECPLVPPHQEHPLRICTDGSRLRMPIRQPFCCGVLFASGDVVSSYFAHAVPMTVGRV